MIKDLFRMGVPAFVVIVCLIAAVYPFSNESGARRLLETEGYTNIRLDGHAYLTCSERDTVTTRFHAVSRSGQEVKGAVCEGLIFKGSYIRID